jgi:hypothetical protein
VTSRAGDGGASSSWFTVDREASLVAGLRRGMFQWRHRVPAVLDNAPVGAEKVVERRDDGRERG